MSITRINSAPKEISVEGCTVNYENDLTLKQKSKSDSYQKCMDDNLSYKQMGKEEPFKKGKINMMNVQRTNTNDVTELSSTKPVRFMTRPSDNMMVKNLNIKADSESSTQERICVKSIRKTIGVGKMEIGEHQYQFRACNSNEFSASDTKELVAGELKRNDHKYDPSSDITRKEFNFNESLNNDADKIFSNDLS